MVNKEIRTNKRIVYAGAVFKYNLSLAAREKWQEKYTKYLGTPKQLILTNKISQNVQSGMRKITSDYIATGEEFERDCAELTAEVMKDVSEATTEDCQ